MGINVVSASNFQYYMKIQSPQLKPWVSDMRNEKKKLYKIVFKTFFLEIQWFNRTVFAITG